MKIFSRIVTVFSREKRISRITLKNFIIKYELSLKCKFESETLGSYFSQVDIVLGVKVLILYTCQKYS